MTRMGKNVTKNVIVNVRPVEAVQAQFEQAETYWKLAAKAKRKAAKVAFEDMARECIDKIRGALH